MSHCFSVQFQTPQYQFCTCFSNHSSVIKPQFYFPYCILIVSITICTIVLTYTCFISALTLLLSSSQLLCIIPHTFYYISHCWSLSFHSHIVLLAHFCKTHFSSCSFFHAFHFSVFQFFCHIYVSATTHLHFPHLSFLFLSTFLFHISFFTHILVP